MGRPKTALQYAALPYRVRNGALSVMLITSRETGRWVIPKGWPENDLQPHQVATREAYEEAGLKGRVETAPFAAFEYLKRLANEKRRHCTVLVFPLRVEEELDVWPEMHERRRQWMTPAEASECVDESELVEMLRRLSGGAGVMPPFTNA